MSVDAHVRTTYMIRCEKGAIWMEVLPLEYKWKRWDHYILSHNFFYSPTLTFSKKLISHVCDARKYSMHRLKINTKLRLFKTLVGNDYLHAFLGNASFEKFLVYPNGRIFSHQASFSHIAIIHYVQLSWLLLYTKRRQGGKLHRRTVDGPYKAKHNKWIPEMRVSDHYNWDTQKWNVQGFWQGLTIVESTSSLGQVFFVRLSFVYTCTWENGEHTKDYKRLRNLKFT